MKDPASSNTPSPRRIRRLRVDRAEGPSLNRPGLFLFTRAVTGRVITGLLEGKGEAEQEVSRPSYPATGRGKP